jgi:hypothetical protein
LLVVEAQLIWLGFFNVYNLTLYKYKCIIKL